MVSASSTDHAEVNVVAGTRQETSCLVDYASSVERLSKLSVTRERAKPTSSTLAHKRVAEILIADVAANE